MIGGVFSARGAGGGMLDVSQDQIIYFYFDEKTVYKGLVYNTQTLPPDVLSPNMTRTFSFTIHQTGFNMQTHMLCMKYADLYVMYFICYV